jgi:hypothetical protein
MKKILVIAFLIVCTAHASEAQETVSARLAPVQKIPSAKEAKFKKTSSGYGVFTWPDGTRFEGSVYDKLPEEGKFYFANGDKLQCKMHSGKERIYRGTYTWKDSRETMYYEMFNAQGEPETEEKTFGNIKSSAGWWAGEFKAGQLNGLAKEILTGSPDTLVGVFRDGVKHGLYIIRSKGKKSYAWYQNDVAVKTDVTVNKNGFYCESGDCENGKGVQIGFEGERYEGSFKDGKFNGEGVMIIENGMASYSGGFQNGAYHGKGKLRIYHFPENFSPGYRDSTYYEGDWRNGVRWGQGKSREFLKGWAPNSTKSRINEAHYVLYDGQWYDNKKNGKGTETYSNRPDSRVGTFLKGVFFEGEYTYEGYTRDVVDGKWDHEKKRAPARK